MDVVINRWKGDRWENDNKCSICGSKGTTAALHPWVPVCRWCLRVAEKSINNAILSAAGKP